MKILVLCIFLLNLTSCGALLRYLESGEVGWALKKEIRDKKSKEVSLARITKFPWDEFFIFEPYTPTSGVCQKLNIVPAECSKVITAESTDDATRLMVFRLKGKVVHSEIQINWHGIFVLEDIIPLTPKTAVFDVATEGETYNGEEHLVLRLKH